jgi:4'-phosphopantetheinyl transferase
MTALPGGEVHVWVADLDEGHDDLGRYEKLLAPEELARASRFRRQLDRRRYTVGRSLLRELLAGYLGTDAAAIRFDYNRYGRPSVVRPENGPKLSFNLSHTGPLALYAASADHVLGIDVERVRHDMDHLALGEHFFARTERAALRSVPPRSRADAFFNCWTRKEAFVKAHGMGLSLDLTSFEVTLEPGAPAMLISALGGTEEVRRWHFESFVPRPGHVAALAVRGRDWSMRFRTTADLAWAN